MHTKILPHAHQNGVHCFAHQKTHVLVCIIVHTKDIGVQNNSHHQSLVCTTMQSRKKATVQYQEPLWF